MSISHGVPTSLTPVFVFPMLFSPDLLKMFLMYFSLYQILVCLNVHAVLSHTFVLKEPGQLSRYVYRVTGWTIQCSGSGWDKDLFSFFNASGPALAPTQPPVQWVFGVLSLGAKRNRRGADDSPLMPRLRMIGITYISSVPHAVMACAWPILLYVCVYTCARARSVQCVSIFGLLKFKSTLRVFSRHIRRLPCHAMPSTPLSPNGSLSVMIL